MSAPRPNSASRRAVAALALALGLTSCASAPPSQPIPAEAAAARTLIERRWQAFGDLRTLADISIRRGDRSQRLSGVLLLQAPSSLRFEALSPFGPPVLLVGADAETVTIWEVFKDRAFVLPSSPEANRRWLGLALASEDLVALLSGHVLPLKDPLAAVLGPSDDLGQSLTLTGATEVQRIWFDPSGQARQVEWTGGKNPARVRFTTRSATEPPTGLTLTTLDGKLDVTVRYREPRMDTGFDPKLLRVTLPEGVKIQDFR